VKLKHLLNAKYVSNVRHTAAQISVLSKYIREHEIWRHFMKTELLLTHVRNKINVIIFTLDTETA
jgi:hypothetical protein